MSNTAEHSKSPMKDKLRETIGLFEDYDQNGKLVDSLRTMLAGFNYDDVVLIKHGLNEVLQAVTNAVAKEIEKLAEHVRKIREHVSLFCVLFDYSPPDKLQFLASTISSSFDKLAERAEDIRVNLINTLRKFDCHVENSGKLVWVVREIRELKNELLSECPWDGRPLPPLDWEMVAQSRAEFARGE